ncbi:hypothetical protein ABEB36_000810 [Hypothenemus hampei]|uniref:Uncharacterized protein n=1 Tax=Hypothenemus hampei TaxID=57062 RepID=A0ABD1FCJ5_HYPHA
MKAIKEETLKERKPRTVHFKGNEKPSHNPVNLVNERFILVSHRKSPPPENFYNLLIFHLNKLKNGFSNHSHIFRENSNVNPNKTRHKNWKRNSPRPNMLPFANSYTSKNSPTFCENEIQEKLYNMVHAALEYGCASNIVKKKGNYFILKNNNRYNSKLKQSTLHSRYCKRCCNNLKNKQQTQTKQIDVCREKPLHDNYEKYEGQRCSSNEDFENFEDYSDCSKRILPIV